MKNNKKKTAHRRCNIQEVQESWGAEGEQRRPSFTNEQ